MRNKSVWERACGLTRTVVERVDFDERRRRSWCRCGRSRRREAGAGTAVDGRLVMTAARVGAAGGRWISGTTKVFLEADAPRVRCRTHGVTVAAVPWARHDAGHTRDFDDLAGVVGGAHLEERGMELLRVAWRTVGAIVARVNADIDASVDRLEGLRRIGIDEISYKRGHRYLTRGRRSRQRPVGVGRAGPQLRHAAHASSTSSARTAAPC